MTENNIFSPRATALVPFIAFLAVFIGGGVYFSVLGVQCAFYQIPIHIAILPATLIALFIRKKTFLHTVKDFALGMSNRNIITMCSIFLLSGAFTVVTKSTGAVDASVNFGLAIIPNAFLLPGFFIISAFLATAMGTSMGTIAALAPIALELSEASGTSIAIMSGTVISGAMFGDNLSIISDTTIASTTTQGCKMKDKFIENSRIAIPAALLTIIIFYFLSNITTIPITTPTEWLKMLPYCAILCLALLGCNVFIVLLLGIALAGLIGISSIPGYNLIRLSHDIYIGFLSMQNIFVFSILIGGLSALLEKQGGLAYINQQVSKWMSRTAQNKKTQTAELGIASIISLTTLCTANNTIAIICSGEIAKNLAKKNTISAKRAASILDIFSCIIQGLIPYSAQTLLLASIFHISPITIVAHAYYPMSLAVFALYTILKHR